MEDQLKDLDRQGQAIVRGLLREEREVMRQYADIVATRKAVQSSLSRVRRTARTAPNSEALQREVRLLIQGAQLLLNSGSDHAATTQAAVPPQNTKTKRRTRNGNGTNPKPEEKKMTPREPKSVGISPHAARILFHALDGNPRSLKVDLNIVAEQAYAKIGGLNYELSILHGRAPVTKRKVRDDLTLGDGSLLRKQIGDALALAKKVQMGEINAPDYKVHRDLQTLADRLKTVKPGPLQTMLQVWGVAIPAVTPVQQTS